MNKVGKAFVINSLIICTVAYGGFASNDPMSARAYIDSNSIAIRSLDETVEMEMKLITQDGKERDRKVIRKTKRDKDDNLMSLIRFTFPQDVSGTGFLTLEKKGADDEQWLYLPALGRSRRISSSNNTDNFMGSDFTYEDLQDWDPVKYQYTRISTEEIDGKQCEKIEAVAVDAKEKKNTGYSKRNIWIDKESYMVLKIEYYDKNNQLSKISISKDIKLDEKSKKWRIHFMEMKNLKTEHRTQLLFKDYHINEGVNDEVFTKRELESK